MALVPFIGFCYTFYDYFIFIIATTKHIIIILFYDKRCAKQQEAEVRPLILLFEMINGKKSWMEKYAQFYHGLGCDVINVGVRLWRHQCGGKAVTSSMWG